MADEALPGTRLIVFDLDGVLVDTRDIHYRTLNQALSYYGYPIIERPEHETMFDGLPTQRKLELLDIADERVRELKQELTREELRRLRVSRRFCNLFARLVADGYVIGVASNAVRETVLLCLKRLGVRQMVSFTLSNEDVAKAKPAPDIYVEMCRLAGVLPSEALVVEDRPQGVMAAHRAGCRVIQVSNPEEVTYELVGSAV